MNILVTGGAGFIGKNLCKTLLSLGHSVWALDNFSTGSKTGLNLLKTYKTFTFVKHDIVHTLPKKIEQIRFEQIFHLACPTGVPNLVPKALEMLQTSSIGTKHILDLAVRHNASVVFTSSSEVYGNSLVTPQHESYTGNVDPTGIRSPYEEGKRFAEALVSAYVRKKNLNAKIVRLFNTYGPGMELSETRVIPRFIQCALSKKSLQVQGNGQQTRTFCYVDDLVSALVLVMKKGKIGNVYNVGTTKETKIVDLANLVIALTKSNSRIIFIDRHQHDHDRRHPNINAIKSLGWKPHTSLRTGLLNTIKSYT